MIVRRFSPNAGAGNEWSAEEPLAMNLNQVGNVVILADADGDLTAIFTDVFMLSAARNLGAGWTAR